MKDCYLRYITRYKENPTTELQQTINNKILSRIATDVSNSCNISLDKLEKSINFKRVIKGSSKFGYIEISTLLECLLRRSILDINGASYKTYGDKDVVDAYEYIRNELASVWDDDHPRGNINEILNGGCMDIQYDEGCDGYVTGGANGFLR